MGAAGAGTEAGTGAAVEVEAEGAPSNVAVASVAAKDLDTNDSMNINLIQ